MASSAIQPDPPTGEHLNTGQTNKTPTSTPPALSTTNTPTHGTPLSYSSAIITVVLGSNGPLTKPRTWRESTSQFSVYYNTPLESSPDFVPFFNALLQPFSTGEIIGLNSTNKAGTLYELHLTSKDDLVIRTTVFASPAIASFSKLFQLNLLKLPHYAPEDYDTLTNKLRTTLAKYGYVHNMIVNTLFGFMDGTGYAYVERPPNKEVGHLCSRCPHAAEVDNLYKREQKTPVQHGPPTHTRPSVPTTKKPAGQSVVIKTRFEILDTSLSSVASKHNPANANIVSKDKKINNSPVEGIETGPIQLELPKRIGTSIEHFDFSAIDRKDRETIPEDDPDLTDHNIDEVDNYFETDIDENNFSVHDTPHPLQ
ncbi:hypothetical protein PHYBLDRAFT_164916 [Phycomyces blakesleeanus NRRL 1555(-)]|uniref:Uncharacterized protein n=1 Tax=Phycomyces blakesleeanus (strain ATCC 8743b / DSM 1359 / FGSC 10004 / NBRC 33097 / NRRL 1555) TaxID=763407 RepID=A0A167PIV0_PHYB8|nr:hypothetical protein PHYBLDRAFT_164916 [Phycomyces blakesleeanus NRRL 1555(-)]OAD78034.1 hypothetical protein PHYBLDRAFT_164916 [Phycomyces blakesleeanus NRRL 1555(-)]|eukprot:XP_018296074.1 hypothetical protein PHYBLDRAFT_164916 [Phycomyces blakesleeanus NRRL 1555(-)]